MSPAASISCISTSPETSSNIVFERPGVGGEPAPPSDARKQWTGGDGASLVAMLQEKTLQTATYGVQKGATQSKCWYHHVCCMEN